MKTLSTSLAMFVLGFGYALVARADAPVLAITYPIANSTIVETITPTVRLQAAVLNSGQTITSMSFLVCPGTGATCTEGAVVAGTVTSGTLQVTWTPPLVLSDVAVTTRYLVWVSAVNSSNQTGVSSAIPFAVLQPPPLPSVTLVAPGGSSGFVAPASPVLYAKVQPGSTSPPSTIAKVDFLDGTTVIATLMASNVDATSGGYAFVWSNAPLGAHQIAARVTDSLGDSATSPSVPIYVVGAYAPPHVALTAPLSGQIFTQTSAVPLAATATSSQRTIQRVEFLQGQNVVASSTVPPFAGTWVNPPAGNMTIVARAFDDLGVAAASPAAYVQVLATPRPPVVVMTSPVPESVISTGVPLPLSAAALAPDGGIGHVDFYVGSTMIGTSSTPPYNFTWASPPAGALSLTAKAYDLLGVTGVSAPVVVISGSPQAPTVTLTKPAAGAAFVAPATVALAATASSGFSGGSINKVEFYANGSIVGSTASPPYTANWSNVAAGTYALTAVATDNLGTTKVSSTVTITVTATPPPTIALTAPTNNATFIAPASIGLSANATAGIAGGSIAKVEFYAGSSLVATASTAPFAKSWSNVRPGSYVLTAKATDNLGGTKTSTPVSVTVTTPAAPTIVITAPAAGTHYTGAQSIAISAQATAPGPTITRVDFAMDGALLGSVNFSGTTQATANFALSGASSGPHSLTATVVTAGAGTATSPPISVVVTGLTVALTAPGTAQTYAAGSPITLTATAAESGGTVTRVDFYKGSTLLGSSSAAPYTYLWSNPPAGSYPLFARATDSGNNAADSPTVTATFAGSGVTITSPLDGAAVAADLVLVRGTFVAPANSGVTVNGLVADNDGKGNFILNNLPLQAGTNSLVVTLTMPDGTQITKTINITSSGTAPMVVDVDPGSDLAPAVFTLTVKNRTANQIASVSFSNLGGGQVGPDAPDQTTLGTITYNSPGIYLPTVSITDSAGIVYTQNLAIVVQDQTALDQMLTATWVGFANALASGNKPVAMQALTGLAQAKFGPVFDALMPHFPAIVATWSAPQASTIARDYAEYGINKTINGMNRIFLITFVVDSDGVWRMEAM
ncbi:MAG TPA: Ig-like domain-containing protein [Casimicrobiaceae bacterium]|jgi:hypothetical protein